MRPMHIAVLAVGLSAPAVAQDEPTEAPDPSVVLTAGPMLAISGALFETEPIGIDPMLAASLEIRFDSQISGRLEVGGSPFRGRVHVGIAGRAYPAGRGRAAWYGELVFRAQRTGPQTSTTRWEPRPGRGWISLPLMAGGGWRFIVGDGLAIDLCGSVGPTFEIRPGDAGLLSFGVAAQGGVFVGYGF